MYFGSAAITIEGGTISTEDGDSLWEGLVDGAPVATIFDGPYSLFGAGTADDSDFVSGGHGGASDSIGIHLSFSLSPDADMTITTGWGILQGAPAPGALALLGLAGIRGSRRRH
jgi:MYXO-CTERM domain-containing protein